MATQQEIGKPHVLVNHETYSVHGVFKNIGDAERWLLKHQFAKVNGYEGCYTREGTDIFLYLRELKKVPSPAPKH